MRQPVRELVMSGPQARLDGTQWLLQPARDLAVRQPFEIRQRHDAPQLVRQRRERGVDFAVQRPPRNGGFVRRGVLELFAGLLRWRRRSSSSARLRVIDRTHGTSGPRRGSCLWT